MSEPTETGGVDTSAQFPTALTQELQAMVTDRGADSPAQQAEAIDHTKDIIARVNSKLEAAELPVLAESEGRYDVIDALPKAEFGLSRSDRAIALGVIALANRPDDKSYQDESVERRQNETNIDRTWRKAINGLRDLEHMPNPGKASEDTAAYIERAEVSDLAHNILLKLATPEIADEDVLGAIEAGQEATLGFRVLAPGSVDRTQEILDERQSGDKLKRAWDTTRMTYLLALRDEFGGQAYYPTREKMLGVDARDYMVVVLELPGKAGEPSRRIAIADRITVPTKEDVDFIEGGAVGAFYAYEENGAGTWMEVFGLNKDEIKDLGPDLGVQKTTHQEGRDGFDARLRRKLSL